MQSIQLGVSSLNSSRLAYGCWRVAGTWNPAEITPESRAAGQRAIITAYESGYTLFDNADIYCRGEAERLFGETLRQVSGMRERVVVVTKCGIRPVGDPPPTSPGRYDFSGGYIVQACEASLQRLGIDTIDVYLLHRPDFLANPEEIAEAFTKLRSSGKVRYFGVSNFRPTLMTALQAACPMPLVVHQMEISLLKLDAYTDGTLDQCLIEHVTPQAWSPLGGGVLGAGARNLLPSQRNYQASSLYPVLDEIARAHGVTRTAVAVAWLMLHPTGIQPVIGSISPERIREAAKADAVRLSREEWYRLLIAARGEPLP